MIQLRATGRDWALIDTCEVRYNQHLTIHFFFNILFQLLQHATIQYWTLTLLTILYFTLTTCKINTYHSRPTASRYIECCLTSCYTAPRLEFGIEVAKHERYYVVPVSTPPSTKTRTSETWRILFSSVVAII